MTLNETQWMIDSDISNNPITPEGRYLILRAPAAITHSHI